MYHRPYSIQRTRTFSRKLMDTVYIKYDKAVKLYSWAPLFFLFFWVWVGSYFSNIIASSLRPKSSLFFVNNLLYEKEA